MQFHEENICKVMMFRLYIVHNKLEMVKIGIQTREKWQVLSQVLTVKTGFLFLRQKRLFLSTSCTQNFPETKRLKFEMQSDRQVLIFETTCF